MKGFAHTTLIFYIIAIIVAAAAVYYINMVYNPPQPNVVMSFNYQKQAGNGYINNTLPFTIAISAIYCKLPDNSKILFENDNNGTLSPGSNTFITISANNTNSVPTDCANWGVIYVKANATNPYANSSYNGIVQTSANGFIVKAK